MKKILGIVALVLLYSEVSAAPTFVDSYDVTSEETEPQGLTFNNDGTKMFIIGHDGDDVNEYTLSTGFDVSTATFVDSFDTESEDNDSRDVKFNQNGTKMFVLGKQNDRVCEYTLSTGFDVSSTVTFIDCFSAPQEAKPEELEFNPNGTKMFIMGESGDDVNEYTLSTGFDVSTATFVDSFSVSSEETVPMGLAFTYDGTKMFVTGWQNDTIIEYKLSTAFDVSTATLVNSYAIPDSVENKPQGLTFSSDGSKMFLLGRENNKVYEYTLTCYYGVINCMDPTSDKDDVASVEVQTESAKELIQHTTYPVLNRMEWLRRNSNSGNLSNQNIKFHFSNQMLSSLAKVIPAYLSNETSTSELKANSWSFWSEGAVSVGKIGDTAASSAKNINTSAVTIGADRRSNNNRMIGMAVRFGNDDIDIGNVKNSLDVNAVSLTLYGTRPYGEDKFIDSLIGIGTFKTDIVNAVGYGSTEGSRNGNQIFSSLKIRETFKKNELNFTPKLKLDLGYTSLSAYSENGSTNLQFERQNIGTIITSIGGIVDNSSSLRNGTFKPYFEYDYFADISPSSEQKLSYKSGSGPTYTLSNINSATHNFKSKLGFDFITYTGWNFTSSYQRTQSKGGGYSDALYFGAGYISSKDIEYTMSLDRNKVLLDYKRNINGFDITFGSNYSLMSEIPEFAANLEITNRF